MTSVIVAVVALVGGVLAGLVPTLTTSPRRRMLRVMAEEQALIAQSTDRATTKHLLRAHRESAWRYELWVNVPPQIRTRRVLTLLVGALIYFASMFLVLTAMSDAGTTRWAVNFALMVALLVTAAVLSLLMMVQVGNDREASVEESVRQLRRFQSRIDRRRFKLLAERDALVEAGHDVAEVDERVKALDQAWLEAEAAIEEHRERWVPTAVRLVRWVRRLPGRRPRRRPRPSAQDVRD